MPRGRDLVGLALLLTGYGTSVATGLVTAATSPTGQPSSTHVPASGP